MPNYSPEHCPPQESDFAPLFFWVLSQIEKRSEIKLPKTFDNHGWLMEKGLKSIKMGADKSAKNTPKCPKIYLPKLSAQSQNFGISMKKGFIERLQSMVCIKSVWHID